MKSGSGCPDPCGPPSEERGRRWWSGGRARRRGAGPPDGRTWALGPSIRLCELYIVRTSYHACFGVRPAEERFAVPVRLVDQLQGAVEEFLVHGLHALRVQRPGVLDFLLAHPAELRVNGGIILGGCPTVEDAART